jgi:hypothetical protein
MLSIWKQMVKCSIQKRKNRQLSERLFKKPGSYNVFRSDWVLSGSWIRFLSDLDWFLSDLDWFLSDLDWFLSDLDFRLDLWLFGFGFRFLFGLDQIFLSDWMYQKYKEQG